MNLSPRSNARTRTLSRREGWVDFAEKPPLTRPDPVDEQSLRRMGKRAREEYADQRKTWHANILLQTPQLLRLHEKIDLIVDSNRQDFDKLRGAPVVDALPGLGKTTAVNAYGRDFYRKQMLLGTGDGDPDVDFVPVCRIGLSGNTTMKKFNLQMLDFYGHPRQTGTEGQLYIAALDCVLSCGTKLIIVDDVHFLNLTRHDDIAVSNHLKQLANDFPVTFIFVGVGLDLKGLFSEGKTAGEAAMAQVGRRWTKLTMARFQLRTAEGRGDWRKTLKGFEQQLVLASGRPGMLVELSDYLYERSSGVIASLFELINRGSAAAIDAAAKDGRPETINRTLLDTVPVDEAAERMRKETAAAIRTWRQPKRGRSGEDQERT
jgi:hypothetical protein